MPEPGMGNKAEESVSSNAGNPRSEPSDFRGGGFFTTEGGGGGNRSRFGGQRMMLPAEYADFILEDGRRLEDVLGKSFFKGFKKDPARARVLAERRAQAKRLNQTKSILTAARGVAGAANTAKSDLAGG